MNLKKDILEPVAKRIKDRAESLRGVKQFVRQHPKTKIGIEGWLKVETIEALSGMVTLSRIMNKSMDLVFQGEENLHLNSRRQQILYHIGFVKVVLSNINALVYFWAMEEMQKQKSLPGKPNMMLKLSVMKHSLIQKIGG
jgi:hypothetical protein